ncbi:MAG: VOC family protein [Solirubrobacterales bacterium]
MWYFTNRDNNEEKTMQIDSAQLWVHDQDEALAFYTDKVGFEVKQDVTVAELGNFRWLKVGPVGQEIGIVLMAIPGEPVMDETTKAEVETVMGKGFAGAVFITTDDVRRDYDAMRGRGIEFSQEPTQAPYGIDTGFRDPSGNSIRLTQVTWDE